jgi:hypothetical protein
MSNSVFVPMLIDDFNAMLEASVQKAVKESVQ